MRSLSLIVASASLAVSVTAASLEAQGSSAPNQRRVEETELLPFWRQLGDTALERLTSEALRANNDIRAAQASVRGARSARRLAAFDFAPTVTANTGVFRRRYSAAQLPGVSAADRQQDIYDAGFDASWEVDVFGRVRSAYAAQDAIAASVGEELRDVQLSLVSELARAYFELRGAQRQLAVAAQNAANQRRTLQLTVDRLSAGRGTAFDRERASAQVSTTLAGMTATEARIASATYRIGVLSGSAQRIAPPSTDTSDEEEIGEASTALPDAPVFASVEHLIRRRPDVRGAERRLAAQGALVNVARADYLPRLNVVGSVGYNAGGSELLGRKEASRYAIGPVISWPAFDLGRVRTRVEAARAQVDESRARFDQTVLSARAEAENAIVAYDRARTRVVFLREAARSSERGAELARLRLDGGESDFLEVLDAQRTRLDAEDRLAQGETDAATAFLALYKALGGAWAGGGGSR
jgi:NodT family efflux transporter outer membrane factor (OMF) lipoprotein